MEVIWLPSSRKLRMNYSMMCRKRRKYLFMLGCLLFFCLFNGLMVRGSAEEKKLPKGDILIMYSDGISKEDKEQILTLVKELTYQSFQITFAPATECQGQLNQFSDILCYRIHRYPKEIIQELYEQEKTGNRILNARKNSDGEKDIRIMFLGNEFLKAYLDETGRYGEYMMAENRVGKVTYSFNQLSDHVALAKEDDFIFLQGDLDDTAGVIQVDEMKGYFCGRKGALYHIPLTDYSNPLVKAAASKEISLWKWPYNGEPHVYAQYIVLNKVYPFQNPDKLLEIVNDMIEIKEPFLISVMPVYNNENYPSMQHFCEVLRYAQANGGAVILHSPINQMPDFDKDIVNEYMTKAVKSYMDQGVYPMGMQVPSNWMFDENAIDVMSRFRTVMVEDEEDELLKTDWKIRTNLVYKDGHQWIAPAIAVNSNGTGSLKTYSSAVYLDITEDMETIASRIHACIVSDIPLKSLWDIEQSFWTDEDKMTYKNHIMLVNGKRTENEFEPTEYDENFKYNRNMLQRFSVDLSTENHKLMITVAVIAFLFLFFIFLARKYNKRSYFKKVHRGAVTEEKEKEEKSQNNP